MLIVSQNKEKVLWFGRAFNALEYSEQVDHKERRKLSDTQSAYLTVAWKRLQSIRQRNGVCRY